MNILDNLKAFFLIFFCVKTSSVSPRVPDSTPVQIYPDPGWFSDSRTSIERLALTAPGADPRIRFWPTLDSHPWFVQGMEAGYVYPQGGWNLWRNHAGKFDIYCIFPLNFFLPRFASIFFSLSFSDNFFQIYIVIFLRMLIEYLRSLSLSICLFLFLLFFLSFFLFLFLFRGC